MTQNREIEHANQVQPEPQERSAEGATEQRVDHLVITVHGIRTFGKWQGRLKELLNEQEPGCRVVEYQYGYFSAIAFLIPFLRWIVARQFRHWLRGHLNSALNKGARIDFVAHSFGTYLVAKALPHLPKRKRIHTIIFAGSVLRPSFPWHQFMAGGRVQRVVNECGTQDHVLVFNNIFALLMGMAGRVGFHGIVSDRFINRYYRFGHGGYFDSMGGLVLDQYERSAGAEVDRPLPRNRTETTIVPDADEFMRRQWLPLLTSENASPEPVDMRGNLTPITGALTFLLNNSEILKLGVVGLLLYLFIDSVVDLHQFRSSNSQSQSIFQHLELIKAGQIPGRDAERVGILIKADLAKVLGYPYSIQPTDQQSNPVTQGGATGTGIEKLDQELPVGLFDLYGLCIRPRVHLHNALAAHVRAIRSLETGDRDQALEDFELARSRYVQADAINKWTYGLCMLDYGRTLDEVGQYEDAIRLMQDARKEIEEAHIIESSEGKETEKEVRELRIFLIDSLCDESRALRSLGRWDEARSRLTEAMSEAENPIVDHSLAAQVNERLAWLEMDRWAIDKASEHFERAREHYEALPNPDNFRARLALLHIRHGLALVERNRGWPDHAKAMFEDLIDEIRRVQRDGSMLSSKERTELDARLLNTYVRYIDLLILAPELSEDPTESIVEALGTSFRESYKLIDSEAPAQKVSLLYRKSIAHSLNILLPHRMALGDEVDEDQTDLNRVLRLQNEREWAEDAYSRAQKTFASLSVGRCKKIRVHRKVAQSLLAMANCVPELHCDRSPREDLNARHHLRTQIRNLVRRSAVIVDQLNREEVELLLLTQSLLLNHDVTSRTFNDSMRDPLFESERQHDARQMLRLTGIASRNSSRAEPLKFFNNYHKLAANVLHQGSTAVVQQAPSATRRSEPPLTKAETEDQTILSLRSTHRGTVVIEFNPLSGGLLSALLGRPAQEDQRASENQAIADASRFQKTP